MSDIRRVLEELWGNFLQNFFAEASEQLELVGWEFLSPPKTDVRPSSATTRGHLDDFYDLMRFGLREADPSRAYGVGPLL